jgi:peptide/nickel transport system substrate-binding protein
MRRRLALTLLVMAGIAVAVSLSTGSAATTQTIPVLRVGIAPPVSSLDQTKNNLAAYVMSNSLEQMMVGRGSKIVPWLAASVTQPGKAIYVYHLRKGVKFWDGTELTAADVANAINYNRHPGSLVAYPFTSVKDVSAKGRYDVVFTLKHPDASFRWVPTFPPTEVFQKKFGDAHKGTMGNAGVLSMGTGPWKLVSFDPTQGAEFVANSNYWGPKPQFRRISVKFFADENSEAIAFRSGALDVAPYVLDARAFAATSGKKVITKPSCEIGTFFMNNRAAPWNDIHVRRAAAYALNRQDIIKAIGGYATPLTTIIPPSQLEVLASRNQVSAMIKSLPQYPYSLAKAKQELAQSKYPNGVSADTITINYGSFSNVAQAVIGQLQKIGIKLNLKVVPLAEWYGIISDPNKRPAVFTTVSCITPDPSEYPNLIMGSNSIPAGKFNVANYANAQIDALQKAGVSTADPAKRFAIYSQLLKRTATDSPFVPLFVNNVSAALSSKYTWPTFDVTWWQRVWALEIEPR